MTSENKPITCTCDNDSCLKDFELSFDALYPEDMDENNMPSGLVCPHCGSDEFSWVEPAWSDE